MFNYSQQQSKMRTFFTNYKQKRNIAIVLLLIYFINQFIISNWIFDSDKNYQNITITQKLTFIYFYISAQVYYYYYYAIFKLGLMPKYDPNSLAHKVSLVKVRPILAPNANLCQPSPDIDLVLVAFVVIAPDRFEKRIKIRKTWANNSSNNMRVIFSTGLSKNSSVNKLIAKEALLYNDILQLDFIDSYYKIINKVLLSYKWLSSNCQNARYILRINDDVVVNSFSLIKYLKNAHKTKSTVFGNVMYFGLIVRDYKSKFYVPFEKTNKAFYDPYPEGTSYIITFDLAKRFYHLGFDKLEPLTHTEDVFIGMMVKHDSVELVDIGDKFPVRIQYEVCTKEEKLELIDRMDINDVLFVYEADEFEFIWSYLLKKLK